MAMTYFTNREYEKADEAIEKALQFTPDEEWFWLNSGLIKGKLGRSSDVVECYIKIRELEPDHEFSEPYVLTFAPALATGIINGNEELGTEDIEVLLGSALEQYREK